MSWLVADCNQPSEMNVSAKWRLRTMEEIRVLAARGRRRSSVRLLTYRGVTGGDIVGSDARDDEQASIIGVIGRVSTWISLSASLSNERLPLTGTVDIKQISLLLTNKRLIHTHAYTNELEILLGNSQNNYNSKTTAWSLKLLPIAYSK